MKRLVLSLLAAALVLSACTGDAQPPTPSVTASIQPSSPGGTATPEPSAAPASPTPSATAVDGLASVEGLESVDDLSDDDLEELGVNEMGRVLVGEWHVLADEDGEYITSRETFQAQLQELYDRGYRPITQSEFLDATFPIPAGTSPLLLTFDDSTREHIILGEDGEPTDDSVVGIIEEFAADKPDWRPTAVFAYNFPEPFGDEEVTEKVQWLVDHGYELSNHTVGHADLSSLSSDEVVSNLAENQAELTALVPEAEVISLTLPFGIHPEDRAVELQGESDGTSYDHQLVYLVGSDPTRSPHHVEFDPAQIQRVPAHAVVGTGPEWFYDWLDRLDAEENLKFVSDGDPESVTYPSSLDEVADVTVDQQVRVYG